MGVDPDLQCDHSTDEIGVEIANVALMGVDDVGDLSERFVPMAPREARRRRRGATSIRRSILGFVAVLAVFCCCTGSKEALTITGAGL